MTDTVRVKKDQYYITLYHINPHRSTSHHITSLEAISTCDHHLILYPFTPQNALLPSLCLFISICFSGTMWHWNCCNQLVEPDGTQHDIAQTILDDQVPSVTSSPVRPSQLSIAAPPFSFAPKVTTEAPSLPPETQTVASPSTNVSHGKKRLQVFQNLSGAREHNNSA